ncbi:MAG TPA: hypothetical protein PKA27_12590 [Fimbriimonadaceae bacterium]|nr:hypothetical protein [Fimbriimonadaceae bacterium]
MNKWLWFVAGLIILGCGGGGVGGAQSATIVGRILQVETGGAPSPPASVQVGTATTLTDVADGSFSIAVPAGTTSITVDTLSASGVWTFNFPAASGTTDIGDLWVGPNRVRLRGKVRRSTDSVPIASATVTFGGMSATTNASGDFSIPEVAYSNANQTAFWGIVGTARATDYFKTDFTASPNVAAGGVVTVNDILLTPSNDNNPPPPPYNLWGKIAPANQATGTVVNLKQGSTVVRRFNVSAVGEYYFWIEPGTYTIEATKGSLTGTASATIAAPNQVVRKDVTLN